MDLTSSCFANSLSFLRELERDWDLEARMKAQIQTLRLKAAFLRALFICSGKWQIDDMNLKFLLWHIQTVIQKTDKDLQVLWSEMNQIPSNEYQRIIPGNLNVSITSTLLKLEMINPDIQDVYSVLSISTRLTCSTTDNIVESIHILLENLKDLIRCKHQSVIPLKEETEVLEESLRFLRSLLGITKNWCKSVQDEQLKDLFTQAEAVADNTACLLYLCSEDCKMDEEMVCEMKLQISHQLKKMNPVQLDSREVYIKALQTMKSSTERIFPVDEHVLDFLDFLLSKMMEYIKSSFVTCLMNQIEALHEELKILRFYLIDPSAQHYTNDHPNVKSLFSRIKVVVCEAACVVYSCYNNAITEDMAKQLDYEFSDLLQELKVIKEEARDIYDEINPKSFRSNFPQTNVLGFIDFVIQNLKELLHFKVDSISQLQHQIETVYKNMFSLRGYFTEAGEMFIEQELKDPWTSFKDTVYQTDYVIDTFILRDKPIWYYKLGLFDIIEEMNKIKKDVNDIKEKKMTDSTVLEFSLNLCGVFSEANFENPDAGSVLNYEGADEAKNPNDYLELYEDEAKRIKEDLTNDLRQLNIVAIVGMPGIGKTTLGYSIYQSPLVRLYFHVQARCCVTQAYQKRRLFLEIIQEISGNTMQGHGMSCDELAETLYKSLKGKKFLIFFDDLWDIRVWNDISNSFPDDNMGSRIMFTSRFHNIASQIKSRSMTYLLNPLSDSRSWRLLQLKLFQKESCPQEFLEVGRQIAMRCQGLPLAVDLVVGLLRNTERRNECWKNIANSLNTHLLADQQGRCWDILELSYKHLPNHLKPCFLYFGAFPEDKEVLSSELMWLWIAEGFIQLPKDDKGNLEDLAKKYLSDLIARSLILESRRGSLDGVKSSRVHDLLRDFALAKAKEECFMEEINGRDKHLVAPSCASTMSKPYRLSVYYTGWADVTEIPKPSAPYVRSLVLFHFAAACLEAHLFALNNFKLLKVLRLSDFRSDCWSSIFCLVHLRFLSLETWSDMNMIPSEISNLQNLETFLLRIKMHGEIELPDAILNLVKLRHIKIWGSSTLQKYNMEKFLKLSNLQTLSTPSFRYGEDTEKILKGLPCLRKLSCIFLDSWDDSLKCNRFPKLDFLTRLESLKLEYSGEVQVQQHFEFNLPPNLKKLSLTRFFLPWTEISIIGRLQNLEVLKLLCGAFEGKTWDMTEGEFLQLKFLKLENLNIAQWNASEEDHLPCLETLVLVDCNRLEEIPSCLGEVLTLQRLELQHCRSSVEMSARKIEENQKEMGNDQFVVTFK